MTTIYTGIWEADSTATKVVTNASLSVFKDRFLALRAQGFSLESLDISGDADQAAPELFWTGVFSKNSGQNGDFAADLTLDQLRKQHPQQALKCLTSYSRDGSTILYAGAWCDGDANWKVDGDVEENQLGQLVDQRRSESLRLFDIQTTPLKGGGRKWVCLWRPATFQTKLLIGADQIQLRKRKAELAKDGLQLVRLRTYRQQQRTMYAAIFHAASTSHLVVPDLTLQQLRAKKLSLEGQMRLVDLDARSLAGSGDTLALHFRVATAPNLTLRSILASAEQFYANRRIQVQKVSESPLENQFRSVIADSAQYKALLEQRSGFGPKDVGVYLVGNLLRPGGGPVRGATLSPAWSPNLFGIVLNASLLAKWTFAHEVGHVLGLHHDRQSNLNLMYPNTDQIPAGQLPELNSQQIETIKTSPLI